MVCNGFFFQTEFSSLFSERSPPPASKDFVEKLEEKVVRNEGNNLL
jgi:hypothetical protein